MERLAAGGARRAAVGDLRAAPGRADRGRPGGDAAQACRGARPGHTTCGSTSPPSSTARCRRTGRPSSSGSPRRRSTTRCGTPRARSISVRLARTGADAVLEITDDGSGFDDRRPAGGRAGPRLDAGPGGVGGRRPGDRLRAGRRHGRAAGGACVIRVLIADDHPVVRQGLRTFLGVQDDIEVVGEAGRRCRGGGAGRVRPAGRDPARPQDARHGRAGRAHRAARPRASPHGSWC